MKAILRLSSVLAACCLAAFTANRTQAQPVGQWDFENGDLAGTAGSLPLTYLDASTQTGTTFGTTTALGISNIGGAPAKVMKFGAFTAPSGYGMPVSAAANGGGSLVNDWTLIMDLLYPSTSDKKFRALIETDGRLLEKDADFFVNPADGVGISGIYNGNVTPDQWHRIALVVDQDNTRLRQYVDGVFVGQQTTTAANLDGRWALSPDLGAQLFNDDNGDVAPGFVNSIQLRDVALNTGQILALGGPSAAGIPATIPPVPAYLDSSSPAVGDTAAAPSPDIQVTLNAGDSIVTPDSVKLLVDNAPVAATVVPSGSTYLLDFQVAGILDPESVHQVSVAFNENGTLKTNSYTFTVSKYQNLTLPTPFYLETFDELSETLNGPTQLPPGWTVSNQTDPQGATDFDLDSRGSLSYADWALVTVDRFTSWGTARTHLPPIVVNGVLLDSLAHGNLMWAESDQRSGDGIGQFQELYTADIDCSGKTNVYVAWNSIYEQNQDEMDAAEYSIDGGANWLPALYLFCTLANGETSDILYKDAPDGQIGTVIDVARTFARTDANRPSGPLPNGTNYGSMIKAPISDALAPYMKPYINDDEFNGKRVEVVRLAQADGQKKVRFRFLNTGTSAWFWGIDDLGLYEINTPVVTTQPGSLTLDFGGTATFKVVATAGQSYQWLFNGVPLNNQTNDTLTLNNITAANAGAYKVTVKNADGSVSSAPATLTVIVAPQITAQPQPVLASVGAPVNFSVTARGKTPFTYQWQKNGTNIANATNSTYSIATSVAADSDDYRVIVSNDSGNATSSVVHLTLIPLIPITQDLVVHFPFDADATDTSGRGNNGTLEGQPETGGAPPTFPTSGSRIGTGFMHIADGQDVVLGQPEDLNFGADVNFTFSFWLKGPAGAWSGDPSFIGNKNWTDGGNQGLVVAAQGGGTFKENWKAASGARVDSASFGSVADGNWHHVVVSHDRTGLAYYYLDGALKGTLPIANTGDINSLDYYIAQDGTGRYGFSNDTGAHFLDIGFDDFGIWRRLLTPQEVASIYAHGLNGEDLTKASGAVVVLPPNVTVGPLSQVVSSGATVTLSATLDGTAPFTYQWQKNSNNIAGATDATFTLTNFDASAIGDYRLVATNSKGVSTSSAAHLALSSAASLNQDLVAYLKFDGNYADSSGRSNNATAKGPSPGFATGKIGQAFHFITKADGSVINYATLGAPADLLFGTGDFTVSMWVNYSEQTDDAPFISNKDWGSSSNIGWGIFSQENGTFRIVATGTPGSGDNKMDTKAVPNIHDGNWHHILVSFWRGQVTQTYLDGTLVNTTPLLIAGSVDTADQGFAVNIGQDGKGTYTDGGSASIDGLIDDVAIWRRVVTPQEDARIYAAGSAGSDLGSIAGGGGGDIKLGTPTVSGSTITITWNGTGSFQLQKRATLDAGTWQNVGTTTTGNSATDTTSGATGFYRIQKL